ncbi:MAG: TonB-dependent receptor family protein [Syntrophothermus sp.]
MKKLCLFIVLLAFTISLNAQEAKKDSLRVRDISGIEVTAVRSKIPLREIPAGISIVGADQLKKFSKTIAADEALRLVPGVRIDNGTSGSRVHLYIRGQGVLTETGFRGVGVLIDGIPVNDPAGFAPDLFDVDWATVSSIEVVKGLAASLYGTGSTGGVLNITTQNGGIKPVNSTFYASAGSNNFWKILGQVDGTQGNVNYRVSYSHNQGDGYRVHQAFMGDNFSEKINWKPTSKITITQLLSYTMYFNQNSEGISMYRYENFGPTAANTDAVPFNEFQKTNRLTGALLGKFMIGGNQDIQLKAFARMNKYQETSNRGDDHKPFQNYGFTGQYTINMGKNIVKNHLSLGADFQTKSMTEVAFGVTPDPNREDTRFGEDVMDNNTLLINQVIKQRSTGLFLIDKLDLFSRLYATLNLRYDYVYNELQNNMEGPDSVYQASGNRTFNSPSVRFGLAYDVTKYLNLYANYGTGFLVPTGDELYNNPAHWGGFNESIEPSKMQGGEIGFRGDIGKRFFFDITGFYIKSKDEFYRYSIAERGNNTAFYGNLGGSSRTGVETYLAYKPVDVLKFDVAYTFTNCRYTSPDSVDGQFIPQCPQHVLAAEASFDFLKNFTLVLGTQYQSKWYIQTKHSIYEQYTEIANGDTTVRNSWVKGFNIFNAELKYRFKLAGLGGELSLFGKNLLDERYFGFTEPNDPDEYNSYQPAPGREFFVSLRLRF